MNSLLVCNSPTTQAAARQHPVLAPPRLVHVARQDDVEVRRAAASR